MLKIFTAGGDTAEMRSLGEQLIAQADKADAQKAAVKEAVTSLADAANRLRTLLDK